MSDDVVMYKIDSKTLNDIQEIVTSLNEHVERSYEQFRVLFDDLLIQRS